MSDIAISAQMTMRECDEANCCRVSAIEAQHDAILMYMATGCTSHCA